MLLILLAVLLIWVLPRLLHNGQEAQLKQLDLLQESIRMLKAGDVWTYQGITAATEPYAYDEFYDPSPEAEALRIADRDNRVDELEEELNGQQIAALGDIFPGLG